MALKSNFMALPRSPRICLSGTKAQERNATIGSEISKAQPITATCPNRSTSTPDMARIAGTASNANMETMLVTSAQVKKRDRSS